jgi:hypothetical protein
LEGQEVHSENGLELAGQPENYLAYQSLVGRVDQSPTALAAPLWQCGGLGKGSQSKSALLLQFKLDQLTPGR